MSRLLAGLDLTVDVYYLNRVSFLPAVTKEGTAGLQTDAGQPICAPGGHCSQARPL